MLSNRPYLRHDYKRERTTIVSWLTSAIIAAFVLQLALGSSWFRSDVAVTHVAGLSVAGLQAGRIWTLFTYTFLHDPHFIFHVLGSALLIYFLGRELLPLLGTRRFIGLFVAATVVGGLFWTAVHWRLGPGDVLVGATPAVYALIMLFACFFPEQEYRFWLFFIIPVSLKPRHIAFTLAAIDLLATLLLEIPGTELPFDLAVASSAHLGGMLTGFLYYRYFHEASWMYRRIPRAEMVEPARWVKPARKSSANSAVAVIEPKAASRVDLRAEVDRILDKINSHGLASLTAEEKRVLDDAKHTITRR